MLNLDIDVGVLMRGFSKTAAVGFLITGAAIGAAFALLYAPKTGEQTRRDIRRFSKKAANQIDDLQSDIRDQISEGYDQVIEVFDNVKEYVEDGKSKMGLIDMKGQQLVIARAIPLQNKLAEPGTYTVTARITDLVSQKVVTPQAQYTVLNK